MSILLSGAKLRYGGSGEFLQLAAAMPQLPETTSTTGFTLITNHLLQTRYASSLGNIEFDQGRMYSNLPEGTIRVLTTGTASRALSTASGTFVVQGGVGIGMNLWVKDDINVNNLTIGQGYRDNNNIVIIGTSTNVTTSTGQNNISIGYDVLTKLVFANKTIAIGNYALSSGTTITNSIAIGDHALANSGSTNGSADSNIAIGTNAGSNLLTGTGNFFAGTNEASTMTNGSRNISIHGTRLVNGVNNQIDIGGTIYYDGTSLLNINANTRLGLGTASTSTTTGSLIVTGGVGVSASVYSREGQADENYLLYVPRFFVSTGAPVGPRIGDTWIDPSNFAYMQYIKDGTSTFWIQVGAV
jgi:hypothetical protein